MNAAYNRQSFPNNSPPARRTIFKNRSGGTHRMQSTPSPKSSQSPPNPRSDNQPLTVSNNLKTCSTLSFSPNTKPVACSAKPTVSFAKATAPAAMSAVGAAMAGGGVEKRNYPSAKHDCLFTKAHFKPAKEHLAMQNLY